jgi:hypothetical protein
MQCIILKGKLQTKNNPQIFDIFNQKELKSDLKLQHFCKYTLTDN